MDTLGPSEGAGPAESTAGPGDAFPRDFSREEAEFASALRGLFPAEREVLPPLYVQTVLGDGRYQPVEAGFEEKVTYQVFRRLGLPRRSLAPLPTGPLARPLYAAVRRMGRASAALVAGMLLTLLAGALVATPSFAAGMRILLGQTGVERVHSYPQGVRPAARAGAADVEAASSAPPQTLEWAGPSVGNYQFHAAYLSAPQEWSQGAVVDLRYQLPDPTTASGTGVLDIREFQIASDLSSVLQVVADGAITQVSTADLQGVYVDGGWVRRGKMQLWQSGQKSELIFERDGLIFWLEADQRDGMGQDQLLAIAEQLTPIQLRDLLPTRPSLRLIGDELQLSLDDPAAGEVLALVPANDAPENGPASLVSIANWDTSVAGP